MRILLEHGGFDVAEEVLGREAVRRAKDETVDVVLLDLNLPDITGLDVCRSLKTEPATAAIPVLLISAVSDHDEARRLALEAGALDFLPDAIEAGALVDAVSRALQR